MWYALANEFVDCLDVLMTNNLLIPWLQCIFAGVLKIFLGKMFPMNFHDLSLALILFFEQNEESFPCTCMYAKKYSHISLLQGILTTQDMVSVIS